MANANAGIRGTRHGQLALRGQRGDKVVHVSQGDRMEPDLPLFEVLQKPRDVEAVFLEGFLCKDADAPRMRPVLIYQTAGASDIQAGTGLPSARSASAHARRDALMTRAF